MTCLVVAMMGAAPADRNTPIAATPAVGSAVSQEPSSVTVVLLRPVDGPVKVTVTSQDGRVVSAPETTLLSTNIATDLTYGLAKGTYTVTYRIEGSRGPEGGTFQFAYGSGKPFQRDIKTWDGFAEIPDAVALKGDDEAAAAAAGEGDEPASDESPSPSPTPTPSATATASASSPSTAETAAETSESDTSWALWTGLAVLVLLGAGSAVYAVKRRQAGHDDQA